MKAIIFGKYCFTIRHWQMTEMRERRTKEELKEARNRDRGKEKEEREESLWSPPSPK